jgi:GNAT superfamily N-acetyltransferase
MSNIDVDKKLSFHPLTPERWGDLEQLFGTHGAYGGCWCMWWRVKRTEFTKRQGEGNKKTFKALVDAGNGPGIIAYDRSHAVGWCSVAPREQFPVLDRSPVLKRVDNKPVWSIVCFFIKKEYRKQGLCRELIKAAIAHAVSNGASIIEAYPLDKKESKNTAFEGYTGFAGTFKKIGFVEMIRRSPKRPVVRYYVR